MHLRLFIGLLLSQCILNLAVAQVIVDFDRDVRPILETRCLKCHGPNEAKNDFRVDDSISMGDYVEPGDFASSSLWSDYLATDDEDYKMPPASPETPAGLTGVELATIKLWIEEGADYEWIDHSQSIELPEPPPTLSMGTKILIFQGLFHPASTHFPVALLSISTVFLVLSFFFLSQKFESAAFHCLWCGALASIATCVMGWGYAIYEGYVDSFSFDLVNKGIDRHRWLGILVTIGALALIPLARAALKSDTRKLKMYWLTGAMLIGLGVSIVGFQGGELIHGEGHYLKEFDHLFLSGPTTVDSEIAVEDHSEPKAE